MRRARARPRSILSRLQLGLEALYRVETRLDVDAFMIDESERAGAGVARSPREQLLVKQSDEDLRLGLFLDGDAIANLERHDPASRLDDGNFADFCLAVEGVSHFIYVALCAEAGRAVSALELELQAEVDKFVCCSLMEASHGRVARGGDELRQRLYGDIEWAGDLCADERDRYRFANDEARRYAAALDRHFVTVGRTLEMLGELRRFYRLPLDAKLGRIARLAA